jgi:hypothetical protein
MKTLILAVSLMGSLGFAAEKAAEDPAQAPFLDTKE